MHLYDIVFWSVALAVPVGAFVLGALEDRGWFWPEPDRLRGKEAVAYREMLARKQARARGEGR